MPDLPSHSDVPTYSEGPTYSDVAAAAARIAPAAHRTPVLHSRLIDQLVGAEVLFKSENYQRAGAFKFRGAYNALSQFDAGQRRAGVVAYSSGNHAQAIALAAQVLEIPATIVMPLDAPAVKVAATAGYGGRLVRYDRYREDREEIGRTLAAKHGLTLIPPYDHPHVIAGQGTATKELLEQAGELDALFVPVGGGGLLSGAALAVGALSPDCTLYGVEPEAGDDARQSLRQGAIVTIATPQTIADGAQTTHLGGYPFEIIRGSVDDILTVSDAELIDAMRLFASLMKMVVEPTGCLGLAAVRKLAPQLAGRRIGVIVSGGNVDLDRFASLIQVDLMG
jgi:threo-3-hydroxy-L-aspartate ammonia-lyase